MDALKQQQLKRMQSGEADTIWEQQAEVGAVWSDHVRLVLARDTSTSYCTRCQSRGMRQTHADVVKEVR